MENKKFPNRKSYRFEKYDYTSPGIYFITINSDFDLSFGKLIDGKMILNRQGFLVKNCLQQIPKHHKNTKIDAYIILPNHIHLMIIKKDPHAAEAGIAAEAGLGRTAAIYRGRNNKIIRKFGPQPPNSISIIIASFKSAATRRLKLAKLWHEKSAWHYRFNDRIVRDESELWAKRRYIQNNPMNHWIRRTGRWPASAV